MKVPLLSKLRWLKRFVAHPATSPEKLEDLFERASQPAQRQYRWRDGDSLSKARNAHYTNDVNDLSAGLSGSYNFLEGDVWLEGAARQIPGLDHFREPIMAHGPGEVTGLSLEEWLEVGKRSGKGLKIDIKQSAAIPKIIDAVREEGIPEERLVFNADMAFGPGISNDLKFRLLNVTTDFTTDTKEMGSIRKAFPKATIGVGLYTKAMPVGTSYTTDQLGRVISIAKELGGPITFPLRAEFVTPNIVERLKPHGTVSIWNDPKSFNPEDKAVAEQMFRRMGVDGMIDLRSRNEPKKSPVYDREYWRKSL